MTHRKPIILVVDDDGECTRALSMYLSHLGYPTLTASSGEEAAQLIFERGVDLVILDIKLPGKSGLDICREVRACERTRALPIMMITALHERDHKVNSLEAGADDFLAKPVDKIELIARIQSLLRIRFLHEELEKSYARLMELQHFKDSLSSMVSHDINNLLMVVGGSLEMMALEKENFTPSAREDLAAAQEATGDLVTLVSDFMDIARMEENKMTLRPEEVDIGILMAQVAECVEIIAKKAGIILARPRGGISLKCFADREVLRRILMNLVVNAVKFTPPGGLIEMAAEAFDGHLRIFVKDTGPGIPLEHREKIFEKFVQLDAGPANLKRGRGLGLTFCKMGVEAHGGKIWVTSGNEGRGSTFVFALPLPGVNFS